MTKEVSPGGDAIFCHAERDRDFEPAVGDAALVQALDAHLDAVFGEHGGSVFHEIVSDLVHVDVHLVPADDDRGWLTLVTCGMAQRAMTVPEGLEDYRHAELMIALPVDWPLDAEAWEDERWYWPIRLLKTLARLPHEYDTFFYLGHTVPNGDPSMPYAPGTELCGALIGPTPDEIEGFEQFDVLDGRVVHIYSVIPLHGDEMKLKLREGASALGHKLDDAGVNLLVDPGRPSAVVHRRRLFGRG
jgi:Suppressor of fused protein (SUFU)